MEINCVVLKVVKKIIVILLTLLCFAINSIAQSSVYKHDSKFPFIIITKDTVNTTPQFTDKEFYTISTGVIFQVNKSNIRRDDPFISLYRDEVLPRINSNHLQLRKVFIRGAASPEGPYANNQRLGRERTKALLTELQRNLQHQYLQTEIDLSSVTEDYGHLCVLMEQANDADYQVVKKIYDDCEGDEQCCKQKLMAAQGGKLWSRLLKEYFPQLRSARLILWFSEPDAEHAPMAKVDLGDLEPVTMESNAFNIPQLSIDWQPQYPEQVWTRRHMIAVRTNLVHDFFYMPQFGWAFSPNIQLEYYPLDGHYTYNVGMTWGTHRHWSTQEFFQVRDFQLELRRYFKGGGKFTGCYAGLYAHGDKYGIGLSPTKGWEGEGGGAGLTAGYVTPLNKKGNLRLEFMASVGYYMTLFDPYVYGNPITGTIDGDYYYNYHGSASDFKERNHRFTWIGPTNLGIQLTYDLIYRKKKPAPLP